MNAANDEFLLDIFGAAHKRFGRPLLAARRASELRWKIEQASKEPSLIALARLTAGLVTAEELSEAAGSYCTTEHNVAVFGADAAQVIDEGVRLWAMLLETQQKVFGTILPIAPGPEGWGVAEVHPFALAVSPQTPPPVSRLLLRVARAMPVSYALALARHGDASLPPWMAAQLAETWRDGQRAGLCLLASLPQSDVSLDVIPAAERLDPLRLETAMSFYRERLETSLDRAQAAGFPLHLRHPDSD